MDSQGSDQNEYNRISLANINLNIAMNNRKQPSMYQVKFETPPQLL